MKAETSSTQAASKDFTTVFHAELDGFEIPREGEGETVLQRAHKSRLAGLSFSGGGIRSATFCLGVLQALADLRLLRRFHYLSTVSGGGYIGSWLIAWIHRRDRNLDGVASALRVAWKDQPGGRAPEEITFLRRFSNYLTPKLGWLGADTWTVVAIYLRNVLLNMTALMGALAGVLLLPRLVGWGLSALPTSGEGFIFLLLVFFVFLIVAGGFIHHNLQFFRVGQQAMWTADPLTNDPNVLRLAAPAAAKGPGELQPWFTGEFGNFLLGFRFVMPSSSSEADVLLRVRSSRNDGDSSLYVHLGGERAEVEDATRTTGGILGQQEARGARLKPPGEANEMRILCVHRTCTVRLNGRVVNVFRADERLALEGTIGSLAPGAEERRIQFSDLRLRRLDPVPDRYIRQGWVQFSVILPLFLAALLTVKILPLSFPPEITVRLPEILARWVKFLVPSFSSEVTASLPESLVRWPWIMWGALAGVIALVVLLMGAPWKKQEGEHPWRALIVAVLAITAGGLIGGAALDWMQSCLPPTTTETNFWARLVWMPPAFILAVSLTLVFYIGLSGRDLNEQMREWWSRLGAWLLIYTFLWLGLFGVAFYSPPLLHWLWENVRTAVAALGVGWVLTTISSLLAATSPTTGRSDKNRWLEMLVAVGPYVFIAGLIACLAWGIDRGLSPSSLPEKERPRTVEVGVDVKGDEISPVSLDLKTPRLTSPKLRDALHRHWEALNAAHLADQDSTTSRNSLVVWLLIGGGIAVWLLSRRVDINDFSMHAMYRNRLARCYLGASNPGLRRPHLFTGFDPNDDIALEDLDQKVWNKEVTGPYPIINCSLNLVGGDELAWQERKAAAFVFTPKYCGYDFPELPPGFRATGGSKDAYAASRGPLTLATAMAISGAAASPNMGYHTSPAPAFLMTLFNVRLGWWIGNPRAKKGWKDSSPNSAFRWLLAEMFGLTHAKGRYIYLSDGGHFENLGILELVRRRCRFIVACDAEDDHDFEFGGLGNAIEKCRTDLGIEIDIDVEPIRHRDEQGHSRWHCAVGRIRYDKCDPDAHAGTILYLKSSLTGDEDTDVLRYAARSPSFPHETTNDQWFGESQFESYRALGHHAAMSALLAIDQPENLSGLTTERLFVELAQRWYPPCRTLDPAFKRRGETLNAIYETLRTEPQLRFLSQQFYPEWRVLMERRENAPEQPPAPGPWLPKTYEEAEAGLYFCNRMIQLMEDIYHDLHLEQEHMHPDNRGWINLFKHWSWSRMFRVAWTISAASSGARFQNFCERVLDLKVGEVDVVKAQESVPELIAGEKKETALLTSVERELLKSLCEQHGKKAKEACLYYVKVAPGSPGSDSPDFCVGIILLSGAEETPQILYFRIRDHLRRMGLGRRGLSKLLRERQVIGLHLFPPPAIPAGVEDSASRKLFQDIYRGVRLELEGIQQGST